jgi:hypothetical protein
MSSSLLRTSCQVSLFSFLWSLITRLVIVTACVHLDVYLLFSMCSFLEYSLTSGDDLLFPLQRSAWTPSLGCWRVPTSPDINYKKCAQETTLRIRHCSNNHASLCPRSLHCVACSSICSSVPQTGPSQQRSESESVPRRRQFLSIDFELLWS